MESITPMLNDVYTPSLLFERNDNNENDPRELLPFGKQQLHLDDIAKLTAALREVNKAIDIGEPNQESILLQRALLQKALQLSSIGEVEEALLVLEELRRFTLEACTPFRTLDRKIQEPISQPSIAAEYIKDEHSFTKYIPTIHNWEEIESRFKQIFPQFFPKLLERSRSLTHTELKICAMLKSTLRTKDIARLLNQSERNIENHRYRIRKKLNLPSHQSLSTFLELL